MQPHRAFVRNGRLVLDEPTELPEGEEVELVAVDEVLAMGGDCLDDVERERLHAALREGREQMLRGEVVEAREVLARLRARR